MGAFMVMQAGPESLNGLRVLITRPAPLAEDTAAAIEQCGGVAVQFPVIEIAAPDSFAAVDALLDNIRDFELLIFVSVAAMEAFVARMERRDIRLPGSLKIAAMGPKTAQPGRDKGLDIDFVPLTSLDSEGLLVALLDKEKGMQLNNTRVAILRGQSGRELLQAGLQKHGADVSLVPCYTRRVTSRPIQPIVARWSAGEIDVVLITSVSILDGLVELLGAKNIALLLDSAVVTISERIRQRCLQHGISRVRVAGGVSNDCLIDTLSQVSTGYCR